MLQLAPAFYVVLVCTTGQSSSDDDPIEIAPVTRPLPEAPIPPALRTGKSSEEQSWNRGISISTGMVIVNGRTLESPYVVSRSDGNVYINGKLIASFKGIDDQRRRPDYRLAAQIERELLGHRWTLVFDGGVVGFVDSHEGMILIGTLAHAKSRYDQAKLVMESLLEGTYDITTAEWLAALERFQPDTSIVEQFEEHTSDMALLDESPEGKSEFALQVFDSTRTMFGLSVAGMLLIAVSTGILLRRPPGNSGSWSRITRSPRAVVATQRCLFLIVAYSLFDLVATILALKTGYVEEMNPFGVELVLAPATLAIFKVSSTCLGAGLLWRLRNYHGAQIASWWLCMVLTLVTARWVIVQSLFFV